ncbi:DUF3108 domain-containing protein [Ponticaulis profundi]|uniref:DUF3108 domain-containing protein n=1 Tax=Ponticaulis profundi TaxID=2665222 RepID=A0ABW1S9B3_9PROT|tara:strand:- start:153 stop:1037 length:885 start_codon:yes stop_codon:yes gene_type:complete
MGMKRKLSAGLAIAALGLSTAVSGATASENPILQDVKDGTAKRLVYEVEAVAYLLFIPVTGKADFEILMDDSTYRMNTLVKTTGIADLFVDYDMRIAASGYITDNGLQTYNYISQNNDGKKNRRVEMTYRSDDVDMVATPAFGNLGFPPATPEQKLQALDPITALMNAAFQPQPADNPCGQAIQTFDGRQLTRLDFRYIGETNVKTKGYKGKAVECHVDLTRVAGYKKGDKGGNLSGIEGPMKIYFGEPMEGFRPMVKFVVDTKDVGKITLSTKKIRLEDVPQSASNETASSAG